MIENFETYGHILLILLPAISGVIISFKKWKSIAVKIHLIRILVDDVDNALLDEKITEAEFKDIFQSFKKVIKG